MLSIATIKRMAENQASLAQASGTEPHRFGFHDVKTFPPFPFPSTGGYIPKGFCPLLDEDGDEITLFCDSSGMGADNEPTLTAEQLKNQLGDFVLQYGQTTGNRSAHLYGAIIELGEFQLVLALYTRGEKEC